MSTILEILLSWTLVVCIKGAEKPPRPAPAAGFQDCKKALKLPGLEVLPGGGWDNLRNLDMGRVINLGYSLCRTTEDGYYIIPDEVFTIPRKQSNMEMNSEIMESWMDYQSTTSASINVELSLFSSVNGKFSSDFRRMKTHQVKDRAVTTRVQVRNLFYTAKFDPGAALDKGFQKQLFTIASHLENNQTRMADFLAEILVLNYGTHVITSVDAGASLVQEDQIKTTFFKDSLFMRSAITASARASFHDVVDFKDSGSVAMQDSFTKQYLANRTNSRIESIGGIPFYPGITLKTWQAGTTNQLVAIDRSGLPLHFFINPYCLPGLPNPTVKRLARKVESAIRRYYTFNTYPGCTDPSSSNFNFHANADDGSCEGAETNFTFGGAYQECAQLEGPDTAVLCQGLEQKNPLTGAFSCPVGYTPVRLSTQEREEGYSHLECHNNCVLGFFCKRVCRDVFWLSKVQFSAYWCARRQALGNSGYLFGGLFSSRSVNPLTNAQSCPSGYIQLRLFDQLKLCVSTDYEAGLRYSVPFGGLFSCEMGNPLAGNHKGTLDDPYVKRCPAGFSQHLALISDGCQVEFCVQANLFTGGSLPPARLPPYTRPPAMSLVATDTVLVTSGDGEHSWIKDAQTQLWRLGDPSEVQHNIKLSGGSGRGLAGGKVAGLTVAITTGLAGLIALAVYGTRRYKKRGYCTVAEGQGLIPERAEYSVEAELGESYQQDPESETA
ncbi:macrophage-expressed gene 1 protein [Alligator mississippiensis]|uniref:macrophage-expressed gene 1 protein n=1 Tax=Alligator mississippiensis TaxID=8496 RepID=UPI0003D08F70|nr:macrophage-expressed gene 1 protein [Alligator mississippiensis]